MMTDNELEQMYKDNISTSHFAGLRGIFDAGYAAGAGFTASQAQGADPSAVVADAIASVDTPVSIDTV